MKLNSTPGYFDASLNSLQIIAERKITMWNYNSPRVVFSAILLYLVQYIQHSVNNVESSTLRIAPLSNRPKIQVAKDNPA